MLHLCVLITAPSLAVGADTAYQTLVSFDAVLVCCELFTFMWTSHSFGILAITLVQVMGAAMSAAMSASWAARRLPCSPPRTARWRWWGGGEAVGGRRIRPRTRMLGTTEEA